MPRARTRAARAAVPEGVRDRRPPIGPSRSVPHRRLRNEGWHGEELNERNITLTRTLREWHGKGLAERPNPNSPCPLAPNGP